MVGCTHVTALTNLSPAPHLGDSTANPAELKGLMGLEATVWSLPVAFGLQLRRGERGNVSISEN